jgi:hypothetical protein
MVCLECGFNGVPAVVSFFKRRLKRRGPVKGERKTEKKQIVKQVIYKPLKCCKGCGEKKEKLEKRREVLRAEHIPGKTGSSRRNFLKRLKRRVVRRLQSEFDEKQDQPMPVNVSTDTEAVIRPVSSKRKLGARKSRLSKRLKKIHTGEISIPSAYVLNLAIQSHNPSSVLWNRISFSVFGVHVDDKLNYEFDLSPQFLLEQGPSWRQSFMLRQAMEHAERGIKFFRPPSYGENLIKVSDILKQALPYNL